MPRLARRLTARFVAAYFVLYVFPFPLTVLPFTEGLLAPFQRAWEFILIAFGTHVLRVDGLSLGRGSDSVLAYVELAFLCVLAIAIAIVWTRLDRTDRSQPIADEWVSTYLRYYLAYGVIGYGMIKIIRQQFPFPALERWIVPFGESSPQGLLWTFMGYSRGYSLLGGVLEVAGSILLCTRRTAGAGALILIGVMANVAAVNLFYDVNLKITSTHFTLMAIYLAVPYFVPIAKLLTTHEAIQPRPPAPISRRVSLLVTVAGSLLVAFIAISSLTHSLAFVKRRGFERAKPALYGIYRVDTFERDGVPVPALQGDATRWSKVVIDVADEKTNTVIIKSMSDALTRYLYEEAPSGDTLKLTPKTAGEPMVVRWSRPDATHLELTSNVAGGVTHVTLARIDQEMPLLKRKFRWVSE